MGPVHVDRRPPADQDHSNRFLGLAVATGVVLVMMTAVFWSLAATDATDEAQQSPQSDAAVVAAPTAAPTPTPTPTPAAPVTPPAPASSELSGNEWVLSPYAIVNDGSALVVTGTMKNFAAAKRSATVRVFVYVNGQPVATAVGEIKDVPSGGSVEVSLPSGTPWVTGNKVLLATAENLP